MKHLAALTLTSIPVLLFLAGCGDGGNGGPQPGPIPVAPVMNLDRDVLSTALALDVTAMTGEATIALAPSDKQGASFEVPGLIVQNVEDTSGRLEYTIEDGRLDVGVQASAETTEIRIEYTYATQDAFDGYLAEGLTFLWPRFCGNLFPCKSTPSEGVKFEMALTGIPMGDYAAHSPSRGEPWRALHLGSTRAHHRCPHGGR